MKTNELRGCRHGGLPHHLHLRAARLVVLPVILEAIQVLVSLAAYLASVWLLLFHSDRSRIRHRSDRIDDGEGAVFVLDQFLVAVAMLQESEVSALKL